VTIERESSLGSHHVLRPTNLIDFFLTSKSSRSFHFSLWPYLPIARVDRGGVLFDVESGLSRPVFTGKIAYRGMVPMEMAMQAIGEQQAKNRQMDSVHHGLILPYVVAKRLC
jgi:hypothetical protein